MKKRKLKLKLKGRKTYQNTHGTTYRVKTKPRYKAVRRNLLKKQEIKSQQDASISKL